MTATASLQPRALPCLRPLLFFCLIAFGGVHVSAADKKSFDLPADAADKAIKRFSEQTGLEVFYPSSAAKGRRTQPVKGEMTDRQALDVMLTGTGLSVIQDKKTGAFTVSHDHTGQKPVTSTADDRPSGADSATDANPDSRATSKKKAPKPKS